MKVEEKRHRLPKEFYKGEVAVAFTLCLRGEVAAGFVLDNPVRKDIVSSWQEYPFKGTIGCKTEDVLNGII